MIKLISREEAIRRAERIKRENELIYGVDFEILHDIVDIRELIPTQKELSRKKLEAVIQRVLHGYDAPIICLYYRGKLYLLDGHHRVYACRILGTEKVEALILRPKKTIKSNIGESVKRQGLKSIEDMIVVHEI
ncbi:inosine-5-monophosphate dehydrogenase [Thermococcus chitonophagus]|uniref:CBS/parB domain-containing protein n=1 Tax=Thermococcus chitonophagus TaxID=54262 RepID=A0A170SQ28_9EURY|nr:ParB N-terminal domain-containing protein [Thermococcus chitonophagus]ASJ16904.1 inosine-5-monophosphate dehydrogenase [Thermococcus chitonophagus]CUX78384.1 CBS/parB domain-containing protein [Thermococcus chitonophagus]